ncbi:MAG: glutamine synthetase III [Clostridia bacterium]|nr:glutamine synthetase III [Clostridia bacterium]
MECDLKKRIEKDDFGADVFTLDRMEKRLGRDEFEALCATLNEGKPLEFSVAEAVARAMMDWALERGATQYTHWFLPLTGSTAEKRTGFLELDGISGRPLASFSGKSLIKGEADGSSLPSGGLRATFEARGYTTWDCTSPAFIKRDSAGRGCLCIPTAFCSFDGAALDAKTPLLRSMEALNRQALRVLRHLGDKTTRKVLPTVGGEQEYFLIDKKHFLMRKDLIYTGRTLFGSAPAKGQELSDQYYAATPQRVLKFMHELNERLRLMGVPCKTEHNEVAPSQYELAPLFESANLAVDHNQLTMEMMRRVADEQGLTCLLHEKPFKNVNGSGKHNNWSLLTDGGINLLKPGKDEQSSRRFLTFLIAIIAAVDEYASALRMSCATIGNEHRLGGNEAPPQIISVFLGEALQNELEQFCSGSSLPIHHKERMSIGVSTMAELFRDDDDRNRTSPFAFTGNKFEFRMVGSSQSLGLPNTVLNTIAAESLKRIADALEGGEQLSSVLASMYREHERVIFNGNNYAAEWLEEAKRRGLPLVDNTVDAIKSLGEERILELFASHGVMSRQEILAQEEIALQNYVTAGKIEAGTMLRIVRRSILPACVGYCERLANSLRLLEQVGVEDRSQRIMLTRLSGEMSKCLSAADELEDALRRFDCSAESMRDHLKPRMEDLREAVDRLECMIDKGLWPLPSYGEILFSVT